MGCGSMKGELWGIREAGLHMGSVLKEEDRRTGAKAQIIQDAHNVDYTKRGTPFTSSSPRESPGGRSSKT